MKTKIALLSFFMLGASPLFADAGTSGFPRELLWIIYFITFLLLVLAFMLYQISVQLKRYKKGEFESDEQKMWDKRSMWEKLFQLKPVGTDKDVQMDHEYDGIRELDNPPPPWFMFLFYGTIVFAVIYFIRFEVTGNGPTQEEEYLAEVAAFEASQATGEEGAEEEVTVDYNSVVALTDQAALDKGKSIYTVNCKICHGKDGMGTATAPNLTDEYWLHGGGVKNIFRTVTDGVPDKGMVPWGGTLKAGDIQKVASYILSLQGSNPEGAWEAEGEIWVPEETTETEASEEAPAEEAGA